MTLEKQVDQLWDSIFEAVTKPPCRECEFWDSQGHYCFMEHYPHAYTMKKCPLVNKITEHLEVSSL